MGTRAGSHKKGNQNVCMYFLIPTDTRTETPGKKFRGLPTGIEPITRFLSLARVSRVRGWQETPKSWIIKLG